MRQNKPKQTEIVRFKLHAAQQAFRRSNAPYRGFVGGRGSGKSYAGAYDLLRRAKPGRLYMVATPTYKMLEDATWRTLVDVARQMRFIAKRSELRLILGNGAEVIGRSMDDPEHGRGPNLSGVWLDEASLMDHEAFLILIATLREGGEHGWLSATFTPKGKLHWTYEVFGNANGDTVALFKSHTKENPFNPPEYYQEVSKFYTETRASQELGGEFCDLNGGEWPSHYFGPNIWFEDWPLNYDWKILGLDPSKGKSKQFGDYSAFVMVMMSEGLFYVDAVVERLDTGALMDTAWGLYRAFEPDAFGIESNANQDLIGYMLARDARARGFTIPISDTHSHGDKVARIMARLTPELKAGTIRFRRGSPGARLLVEQLQEFPIGQHDDGPDGLQIALRTADQYCFTRQQMMPETPYRLPIEYRY